MNLLYTLTAYPPSIGGAQLHHHALAQQLLARHALQVITHWDSNRTDWLLGTTLSAPSKTYQYQHDGVQVLRMGISPQEKARMLPCVFLYYLLMERCVPAIASHLVGRIAQRAQESDLIHNVRIGREPLSVASLQVAQELHIPFIFTPLHHPRWGGWRHRVFHQLYRQAEGIVVLTNSEKDILIELGIDKKRIFVTGVGPIVADQVQPERFVDKHDIDGPFVLFVGQHYRYKGYRAILEATDKVWQQFPDTHFVFIGPAIGNSKRVFSNIKDRRVVRLGQVSLQEKSDALAACTIFCLPSTQESFGGVYTEAWNYGKPVIGCQIPAVSEVIQEGVDGFLVHQSPDEIAMRLIALLGNQNLRSDMGSMGRDKVQSRYSWDVIAARTEDAYREVISNHDQA